MFVLNSNASFDSGVDLTVDLESSSVPGEWMAVWTTKDSLGGVIGTDFDIASAATTNGGVSWSPPLPVNSFAVAPASKDKFPRLATDGMGKWVAAWSSKATLGGTIGSDFDVLSATSTDMGASWSAAAPVNTTASGPAASDSFPMVASDRNGTWLTVWHSTDSLGGTLAGDNDVLCAFSHDAGVTWTAPSPVHLNASTDTGSDRFPATGLNPLSSVTVWQSTENLGGTIGADNDILGAAAPCQCAGP